MAGSTDSFDSYLKSYESCYNMPLDELELHILLNNAKGRKAKDDYEDERKRNP